ncbi:TPA: radical SAM protein [Thermoplasmata archaeon]|nr:radical SAM protein [Thermoplasmata archaeon]
MDNGAAYTGRLPEGCVLCEKGAKLVLLVTGKCARRCVYCPLSLSKKGRDVFFANEGEIGKVSEAVREARTMEALGTGITGGDPLLSADRTVASIRALKKAFGSEHHIHLYTSTMDTRLVKRVAKAGLDEIRFHPPHRVWSRIARTEFVTAISVAKKGGMSVGLEVPALPGHEDGLRALVSFADDQCLDFVNLNELEFSETNWRRLAKLGMVVKDDVSSGVAGSEELAMALLGERHETPLHYCSSSFKDGVQLRRRITRRGRNVMRPHELLTEDGTLVKGVIESESPSRVIRMLLEEYDVPPELVWHDREKARVEVAEWVLREIASELEMDSCIVEEYPTADRLEVEREPLRRR